MVRTLTSSLALLTVVACGNDLGIQSISGPPPVPAERPPEVVTQTDFITQVTTPEVDVLFVIDNSGSMGDDQKALADNFPTFMTFFEGSGLDYHIGSITTDTSNQSGPAGILTESDGLRYITPDVPRPSETFRGMALVGVSSTPGAQDERGLEAQYTMLELKKRAAENRGFYRQDAAIHSVIVSDEPDHSDPNIITIAEWIRWYDGLKSSLDDRSYSSIVCRSNCGNYRSVTEEIGGVEWNIEDDGWDEVLERLGIQASGLKKEYFLSQTPVVDTIEVSVLVDTGAPQPVELKFEPAVFDESYEPPLLVDGEWTYDAKRNSITFQNYIPNPLDTVKVSYTLLSATQVPLDEDEQPEDPDAKK